MAELFADANQPAEPQVETTGEATPAKQDSEAPPWAAVLLENVGRMIDDKIKSAIPQAPAPKAAPGANAPLSLTDVDEAASRRYALDKAIEGLPQAAQEKLRELYVAQRPKDVAEWVSGWSAAFGLGKGQPMTQGTNNGGVPVTNGGVPKIDRSLSNYAKHVTEYSDDDIKDMVRSKTLLGAGRALREQLRRDLPGLKLQIPTGK